jgi:RNA polymerase sigma-70 factor (ECF subfamily)
MERREIVAIDPRPAAPAAVGPWLTDHEPALRAAATGLCRARGGPDLDDLIQDTFERALRHFGANRPAPDNLRAWLVSIMRHVFIDRLRTAKHNVDCSDELPAPEAVPEPIWADVSIEEIQGALVEVEPSLRAPFELHYLRGVPYAEIAATLKIPMNTVASRLFRARKALREVLLARRGGER